MTGLERCSTIEREAFGGLFELLKLDGYTVIGPTVRGGAIVYEELSSEQDLPVGTGDYQDAAEYRLIGRDDQALFGHVVGPQAWKKFLYPPRELLCSAVRSDGKTQIRPAVKEEPRYAFVGVRACDLAAIQIQDRIFMRVPHADSHYWSRRDSSLIVAVNCTEPGGTCFCSSMGTGPEAREGFDLGLTEILEDHRHYFLARAGSERGRDLLERWGGRPSSAEECSLGAARLERASLHMGRWLDTEGLAARLQSEPDHPRWDDVSRRCLNCANCTLVCPTCFCSTVEDSTDLAGTQATRHRLWDSCFTLGFSYIHGGSLRTSAKSRYRQWLTHKLSSWHDQFDTSGCVGCGRCITWCPAGIDLTEEARALAEPPALAGAVT
jgi:ferredoxin